MQILHRKFNLNYHDMKAHILDFNWGANINKSTEENLVSIFHKFMFIL